MARKVFFSFHYKPDSWRASQVRQIGVIEGNQAVAGNEWEAITSRGTASIKAWIDGQMKGKSCAVVLIGSATAGRKWITYEISTAWTERKGVFGIYIHNLKDYEQTQSVKGSNPFERLTMEDGARLSTIVKAYDPPFATSTYVYSHIKDNIETWVEKAISIRGNY